MKQTRRVNSKANVASCAIRCDVARESILSGDLREALWHLRQAVEVDRDSATAWQLLGHCFERLGEETRARRCYALAFRLFRMPRPLAGPDRFEPLPIVWPQRALPDA